MISTHDAICFFVQDPLSARNTLSRWITECNRLDLEFRPAAVIILDSAVENDEADRLRSLLEEDPPSAFFHSVSVHSVRGYGGRLPNSVFGRMREVRAMRNANHLLWDWYTMFKLSHGLLRQLAGRSPSPQRDINVGYVSALDLERTPQPLQEATEWLADAWCSWIEQTTSEDEALQMRLPILAHAIAVDAAISYKGFHVRAVFDQLHRHIVKKALSRQKIVSAAYGMAVVASHVDKTAENALDHMLQHYQKSRVKFLKEHQPSLADSRSSDLCLLCFVRPADIFLPCECALCETCCRSYGRPTTGTVTAFDRCVWCGMLFAGGCAIRQKPITAGCRVLALDGGGVKGIVQLHVLEAIEKLTKLPIRIFFDLAIGTSVGGINALSIGVLQWPLDRCENTFVEVAKKIFPKATTAAGRWCQKVAQLFRFVFKDGIYSPSGPVFQSIVGDARMRGPRVSLYEKKPYEQMHVAVTAIDSNTSASRLLTTYTAPACTEMGGRLASNILVREAAETTSAAPCLFPAKRIGDRLLYDGIDIPLPHVRSEARRLFPKKESPDYILSVGCGTATAAPNTRLGCLSRLVHHQLTGMSGHQQYGKLRSTEGDSKVVRVDPVIAMEEVALDDSTAVTRLTSQLRQQLKIDAELWATMKQTSWAMISALFYFQLQKPPHVAGRYGQLDCEGTVACRYEDDAAVMKILATEYPGLVALVDGKEYNLLPRGRAEVSLRLFSWNRRIDIRIKHAEKSASITGFPASMEGIYSLQQQLPLEVYVVQAPVSECLRKGKRRQPAQSLMALRKRRRVAP
ncbi:hypothetical protein CGMCC3_g17730 [Colletotrichum fructicola]|nr:uncharacterized protein CGMCC3_g17730 [Colletotrichum fructicola]KAE9566100.1 hypothetical protein CGMCC3_g17730 [Colletotrichum fructicola]